MKKFDEEFKANAVRLVREERMKIKDVDLAPKKWTDMI